MRNITISGLPGGGSTTLLNLLKEHFKLEGWRGFSGGEFMRAYAAEKGLFDATQKVHHSAEHYEDDFDRKVDFGMREKLESENKWILEAWLSGFFAQGIPGVLKVLVYCSEDAVRIDRIVNRDLVNVDEAKKHIQERYQANLAKWSRMYAQEWQEWVVATGKAKAEDQIDFWRPDLYDVVIDTYSHNQEETLEMVLDAISQKAKSASRRLAGVAQPLSSSMTRRSTARPTQPFLFWSVVLVTLLVWVVYRLVFIFPVWFDEIIGKAVFFGLPVWVYIAVTNSTAIVDTFSLSKLKPGVLQGLAFGGIYGFAATIISFAVRDVQVQPAAVFAADAFWWEFMLALFTGFWETLFFFSFVMTVLMTTKPYWSFLQQALVGMAVFLVFHLPNTFRYFAGSDLVGQLLILALFALGQAFIFARQKNAYSLVVSHAIWGMVLLVHVAF